VRNVYTWSSIVMVVISSTAGDILLAYAMQKVGDLDEIRAKSGIFGAIRAVLSNAWFVLGVACMAVSFFSLLVALSWGEVSLVAPAAASLTFVTNALAARFFLHENVDRRRWIAALFVGAGVALLAK
jgi:drug/metabolite transporter (DMT)-like permease